MPFATTLIRICSDVALLLCGLTNHCHLVNFGFRLHAQALTLAALAGAAVVEYYDHKSGTKGDRYAKYLPADSYSVKD